MIKELDESLVGKTIWYFHPVKGVTGIKVTGVYIVRGKRRTEKYGFWYDDVMPDGKVIARVAWIREYPLFLKRSQCTRWVRAMVKKSDIEAKLYAIDDE